MQTDEAETETFLMGKGYKLVDRFLSKSKSRLKERRLPFFPACFCWALPFKAVAFSILPFQIWFQIGPDARKTTKQADDVVQDLGTSRKPAAFDNADGSIWAVGEKGSWIIRKISRSGLLAEGIFRATLI